MEFAKIILEYIKILMWPAILVIIVFTYEETILDLIKNREIDAFGLKIGPRIEDISKNYVTAVDDIVAGIDDTEDNRTLLIKLDSLRKNVTKELSLVQEQTAPTLIEGRVVSKLVSVAKHERLGFEAILGQDVDSAIQQFGLASTTWPDYHNVSEIEKQLIKAKATLNTNENWSKFNKLVLQKYSWGMPADLRSKFKAN